MAYHYHAQTASLVLYLANGVLHDNCMSQRFSNQHFNFLHNKKDFLRLDFQLRNFIGKWIWLPKEITYQTRLISFSPTTNPLCPSVTNSSRIEKKFDFKIRKDNQKNFQWASRLWVGRRKQPILGYVPKNDEKKNSGGKGLKKIRPNAELYINYDRSLRKNNIRKINLFLRTFSGFHCVHCVMELNVPLNFL